MTKHERALRIAGEKIPLAYRDELESAIAAYLAVMREPRPDEVRVRACVGVDEQGNWQVAGSRGEPDDYAVLDVVSAVDGGWLPRFHFIEANIPAWRPLVEETVEGEVVS